MDLELLRRAVATLEEALSLAARLRTEGDDMRRLARDSGIQRFEYTYELAIRFLRRHLEETDSAAEVDRLAFRDLLRLGAERGLLDDPRPWFEFREKRNLSVHTYSESTADAIFAILPRFVVAASGLLDRLSRSQ